MNNPDKAIKKWAESHKDVQDNPKRILATKTAEESRRVTDDCARKMTILYEAEALMLSFAGEESAPEPLVRYAKAKKTEAKCSCWFMSCPPKHEKCREEIKEFFESRDALDAYGKGLQA